MKKRGVALFVALLLAGGATAAVFLYVQGVRREASAAPSTVRVIVPKRDIAAGTELDGLISAGAFTTLDVSQDAVVPGAVTDLSQLRGRTTSTFILQDEQITTARLQGSTQATGGILGIPKGYQALTFQSTLEGVVGGVLQAGDHVTVYGSFDASGSVKAKIKVHKSSSEAPGQVSATATAEGGAVPGEVVVIVPDVQVLKVGALPNSSGTGDPTQQLVTLALLPQDAEKTLFANAQGHVWLGLIPPGEQGQAQTPVTFLDVIKQQPQQVAP
jgi:pilus assembly protein CpaB